MPRPLIEVRAYELADAEIVHSKENRVMVWHVDKPCVVVGQGNRVMDSLNLKALAEDNITVYRRPSGGQPVFLSPRTLQVSVLLMENQLVNPLIYFRRINGRLIQAIGDQLGLELEARGVSDLATKDERKVYGSSIYRGKGRIFYHGVLNVSETPATISRYLFHPPQEPEYRRGRHHLSFVASLAEYVPDKEEKKLRFLVENAIILKLSTCLT